MKGVCLIKTIRIDSLEQSSHYIVLSIITQIAVVPQMWRGIVKIDLSKTFAIHHTIRRQFDLIAIH
jgi:hypothetical protein